MEHWWNDTNRKTNVLEGETVSVQLCSLHIPHRLACDWTWHFCGERPVSIGVLHGTAMHMRWENNIHSGPVLLSEVVFCIFSEFNVYVVWMLMGREILMRFKIWGSHSSVGDDSSLEGRDAVLLGKYCSTVHSIVVLKFMGHAVFSTDCLEHLTMSMKALQSFKELWITYSITQYHILTRLESAE